MGWGALHKHPFAGGKLFVRIVLYASSPLVNVRRLHRYFIAQAAEMQRK
jgi:hypothetical protein